MRNGPVYIMDVPTSILGRAVPVWMLGPVNGPYFQYGETNFDSGRPVSILGFFRAGPFR